jgi:trigger factor
MKVDVEKADQNTAQILLEIDAEHANMEYNKACKRLGQRLNIPGFRRGKAPRQVVEKAVGIDRIKQEVLDRVLPHAFADAISEHQLDVVAPPQIEKYTFEVGQPLTVKAMVELRPDVTLPDLSQIKVDVPQFEPPADQFENEMRMIRERMTTLETIIDRPAQADDIVNIDFTGAVNGELIRGGAAKNYQLDLASNNFIDGFAEQIPGHKIGEEFTLHVQFPGDYHDPTLQNKPADFKVKINEIKHKVVPEMDDELAKKCGPYQSVNDLETEVRKFIDKNVENENSFRRQKALIDRVVEDSKMDVPDPMINREARILLEEIQKGFKQQGMNWEQFVDSQGHEKIWQNLRTEALQRIKTSLTFGAIAKQESIVVTEEEFQKEVVNLAKDRNLDEKQAMKQLANNPEAAQALADEILSQKIVEFLLSRAEINYVKDSNPQAEEKTLRETVAVASSLEKEEFEVLAAED